MGMISSPGVDPGFGQGDPAFKAGSCQCSGVESCKQSELSTDGALEVFGFLMLKYALSHILETPFL